MAVRADEKVRGVVYGRSLTLRPQPPTADILVRPLRLTDIAPVALPPRPWRERLRQLLQHSGMISIPATTQLQWRFREVLDWLQRSLLGQGHGPRLAVTHPLQLLPTIEFMMGLPAGLEMERRLLHRLLARALIDYRRQISVQRDHPLVFARQAGLHFSVGYKEQQQLSRVSSPEERFHTVQRIYNEYFFFRAFYIFSIVAREPADAGHRLFSRFIRSSFFLSAIQEDGTVSSKPSYRQLPPKEHVVFLAWRDQALQARLREDEELRTELQGMMRYFRPVRG